MRSLSLSGSGHPSASSKPSLSSGSLGHRSSTSGMPSLSLSGSGHPSSSSKPSLSSGSSGHLSTLSGMPSPWRSRSSESGQPSSSSKPFLVSGSLGHLSSRSGMPSRSLSGSGQPSSSSKSSKSSGSSGHLSTSSLMPSPSRSPMLGSKMKPRKTRNCGEPVMPPSLVIDAGNRPAPPPIMKYDFCARYTLSASRASRGCPVFSPVRSE